MRSWLLLLNSNDLNSTDGQLYACTPYAWPSISKFILLLLGECWASNPNLNTYSGLLKGFLSIEDYRYVWFDSHQYAGLCNIEGIQSSEETTLSEKNTLYWFYLPHTYLHITYTYIEIKSLHLGRVPYVKEKDFPVHVSNESGPLTNSELYLVTADPKDLLFYCIQSLNISGDNVKLENEGNNIEYTMVERFPPYKFRILEFWNGPANQVPVQSRSMIMNVVRNSLRADDLKLPSTSLHTSELDIDETCVVKIIKNEPEENGALEVMQETQQNLEDQLQLQHPQHINLPSHNAGSSRGLNDNGTNGMSFSKLLSISHTYGKLVASKEESESKTWRSLSSRVVPSLVLQCPGCGKYYPQSSPKRLYNMLSHIRSRHARDADNLLLSITYELDVLIPFMMKTIAKQSKKKTHKL